MHSIAYLPILHAELVVDVGGADGDGLVLHPGVLVPLLHSVPSTGDHSVGGADGDGLVLHPAVLVGPLLHSVPSTRDHSVGGAEQLMGMDWSSTLLYSYPLTNK